MSDFLKKFLLEDPRKLGATDRHVCVGAFGKHPGWDDHIEDLGLETPSLIQAKTLLYVQGIGSQIDSGGWEKLDPGQQIPAFKHLFLWRRGSQFLLGRMWASSDGKGRTRYPMIACVHGFGVPLPWALREVLPHLQSIEAQCQATRSADDIRRLIHGQCAELRRAFSNAPAQTGPACPEVPVQTLAQFASHPTLGPNHEGWLRILYQLHSQMGAFAPGRFSLKGDGLNARAQQIRLPTCDYSPAEALLLWSRFFYDQVDSAVPVLCSLPLDESWIDVTLGEPTSHEFFALRASPKKFPLVTEVPYNIDTEFRKRAEQYLSGLQLNKTAPPTEKKTSTGTTTFLASNAAPKSKWLRWLVGGGGLALLAVSIIAGVLYMREDPSRAPGKEGKSGQAQGTESKPAAPSPGPQALAQEQAAAKLKAEAEVQAKAKAQAESLAKAAALARAQEEARLQAEAEKKKQMEAEQEAKRLAEARRMEQEKAAAALEADRLKAKAEAEAREKERQAAAKTTPAPQPAPATPAPAPAPAVKPPTPATTPAVAPATPAAQEPASKQMTNRIGLEMVWVPEGFWVGKYEVTQSQFQRVMGSNPSKFTGNDQLPVESVTWAEAVEFCRKLTGMEKESGGLPAGFAYTLPTQKQWEGFLANATFERSITSREQRLAQTGPVGSSAPNQWGLHDLLGNVWEWCLDGPSASDPKRTLLGGAYNTAKVFRYKPFTPTTSQILPPETKSSDTGFRCILIAQK